MPITSPYSVLFAAIAVGCLFLIWLFRRDRRVLRKKRAAIFEPCYGLFQSYRVVQSGPAFPTLEGVYRDRRFQIDTIVDTLTFRKIPVLWLRVSLLQPLPGIATTDILVRVQNNEFYAPANDLPYPLAVPAHWPPGTVAKTDDAEKAPPISLLDAHMDFFASTAAKEMLVTSRGVRLVSLLDQGQRTGYLVLRVADFSGVAVDEGMIRDLLDRCIALADDLTKLCESSK